MKRVLIVEDEHPLANALRIKLETKNFEVEIVNDGAVALEMLKSNKNFNVILLDIMIPNMSGFALLEKVRNENYETAPIIVMTNLSQPEDREKAKQLGAIEFFVKSDTSINEIVDFIANNI